MTYPEPAVQSFVAAHIVAVKLMLNNSADQPHFRAQRVKWRRWARALSAQELGLRRLRVDSYRGSHCQWERQRRRKAVTMTIYRMATEADADDLALMRWDFRLEEAPGATRQTRRSFYMLAQPSCGKD